MAPKGKGKGKGNSKGNPQNQNQSHRNTTTSAAAGRIIPQKLLFNILTRLPVKSLLRFKCVSKQWRTLTSLPRFASAHLSRAPSSILIHAIHCADEHYQLNRNGEDNPNQPAHGAHCIFTYRPPNPNPNPRSSNEAIYDFPGSGIEPFDYNFEVIGSTPNGIVCVSQKQFGEILTLWNPATGLSRSIRAPKLKGDPARHSGASIGLGYDPSQNDIKIVRILSYKVGLHHTDEAEFYSLKSGSWTVLKMDEIDQFCIRNFKCDAMFEGVPYWRCLIYKPSVLGTLSMLLTFSPEKSSLEMEDFGVVLKTRDSPVCMGEIQGCLAAVTWDMLGGRKDACQVLDVWLRYKTVGWKKLYRIDPMPVIGSVLGMYGERGVVLEKENGDLGMFHLKEKVLEDTLVTGNQLVPGSSWLLNYKESLTRIPEPGRSVY